MPTALGLGSPTFPRITYSIFKVPQICVPNIAHSKQQNSTINNNFIELRNLPSPGSFAATSQLSSPIACHAAARPGRTVLDVVLPTSLTLLKDSLLDLENGLLVELHRHLGSQNFSIKTDFAAHPGDADIEHSSANKRLVLTYTTPLPFAALNARNTEKITLRSSGPSSFMLSSCCSTAGVPLSNCFVNKLEWKAIAEGDHATRLSISGRYIIINELV